MEERRKDKHASSALHASTGTTQMPMQLYSFCTMHLKEVELNEIDL
jgi:hypothetical protein